MVGILYFSSTGNSLYIAKRIQDKLGGKVTYIPYYIDDGSEFEKIIIVTPIYSFGMPTFVYDLLPRLDKKVPLYIFLNYGGMVGGADYLISKYCQKFELNLQGVFTVKMPENFTVTFTVPKFYIKSTLNKCDKKIDKVIDKIKDNEVHLPKKKKTYEKSYLKNKSNWHIIGTRFKVSDKCTKCGKCIRICPANNIIMEDNHIVFKDRCVACLGCYHRCPNKAITYLGKKKKDRYLNPSINDSDIGKDFHI